MNASWLFRGAVVFSVAFHAVLLVARASQVARPEERLVQIPVVLNAEVEPPPPPPPPAPPPKPKPRPPELSRHINQVVEAEGTHAGELVEAEVGDYAETQEIAPELAPLVEEPPVPAPRPKPEPRPEVDRPELAQAFLQRVRGAIAGARTYPFRAQRMGIGGSVSVSFVILPDSQFGSVTIQRSSGYDVLDQAALSTVRSISGRLPRPSELGDTPLRVSVNLRYELDASSTAAPGSHRGAGRPHHRRGPHGRWHDQRGLAR